jgi:sugar-phosphatase
VPADCVVIEDTPPGLEAARAAGMRSIGIAGTYPASALIADLVVPSLTSLPAELLDAVTRRANNEFGPA